MSRQEGFAAFSLCALGEFLIPLILMSCPLSGAVPVFAVISLPRACAGFYLWTLDPMHLPKEKLHIRAGFDIALPLRGAFKTSFESLT